VENLEVEDKEKLDVDGKRGNLKLLHMLKEREQEVLVEIRRDLREQIEFRHPRTASLAAAASGGAAWLALCPNCAGPPQLPLGHHRGTPEKQTSGIHWIISLTTPHYDPRGSNCLPAGDPPKNALVATRACSGEGARTPSSPTDHVLVRHEHIHHPHANIPTHHRWRSSENATPRRVSQPWSDVTPDLAKNVHSPAVASANLDRAPTAEPPHGHARVAGERVGGGVRRMVGGT